MEPSPCVAVLCHAGNASAPANAALEALGNGSDLLVTSFLGCILAAMCLVGAVGNVYTLVVTNVSARFTGSMYVYIVNLALADLLYLSTIPFVVCTYFTRDWYFGDLGCRILFSLDLVTMHASIFILTIMSTERYLAVVRPLDTLGRRRDCRRTLTCLAWLVSFLLSLPTMILIDLRTSHRNGVTKRMCHPTWQMETYRVYLTVLFHTCILAPGLIICCLYIKLARTYWRSQTALASTKETSRCPKQKVLYMIFSIVLAYWACFAPFWLWQLFSIYRAEPGRPASRTVVYINLLVTCLAYSNSCINPFLYTLLSENYKETCGAGRRAAAASPLHRSGAAPPWAPAATTPPPPCRSPARTSAPCERRPGWDRRSGKAGRRGRRRRLQPQRRRVCVSPSVRKQPGRGKARGEHRGARHQPEILRIT